MEDIIRSLIKELPLDVRAKYEKALELKLTEKDISAKSRKHQLELNDLRHKETVDLLDDIKGELIKIDADTKLTDKVGELIKTVEISKLELPETLDVNVKNQEPFPKSIEVVNLADIKPPERVSISDMPTLKKPSWFEKPFVKLQDGIADLGKRIMDVNVTNDILPVRVTNQIDPQVIVKSGGGGIIPFQTEEAKTRKALVKPDGTVVTAIAAMDTPSIDAFGRWRVSEPLTLFDSKQIHDNQPLFWDDQQTAGSSTASTYNTNQASTTLSVLDSTAGTRVRQTFQRFNYQPGKSQLVFMTMSEFLTTSGLTKRFGYYDGDNGLFFESASGVAKVVRRTNVTGTAADNAVNQPDWNLDTLDGTGPSGVNLDFSLTQIGIIDFEWLGVGRVRMGFVVDGMVIYCHEFNNANNLSLVYMSTPNLPSRYEISNDGSGAADSFVHICSSVASEGGQSATGVLRHTDSGSVGSLSAGSLYAVLGLRLQSGKIDGIVHLENLSVISTTTNDQAHWELLFNPTVAGTFTYSDQTNSVVQTATGANTNTVTNGTEVDGGYFTTALPITQTTPNALRLGAAIDGTVDEVVLAVKPITNNITVQASWTWRELS